MKLGIVGPAQSGKTTIFTLLVGEEPGADALAGRTVTKVVRISDRRLEHVREVFQPRSFKPATFTVTDYGSGASKEQRQGEERNADALLIVLPAFGGKRPSQALSDLETEWALLDLEVVLRRIDKIDKTIKKPIPQKEKDELLHEQVLLRKLETCLSEGRPARSLGLEAKDTEPLRAFGLFTLKPQLIVLNVGEDAVPYDAAMPEKLAVPSGHAIAGRLEAELAVMEEAERTVFQGEYGIAVLARDRLARAAFELLGLHAFYTYGEDEVRAWTIKLGTSAVDAAGEIHSDIQRGFIRAEVLSYDDFAAHQGDVKRARAAHKVRLEGKAYVVKDADMVEFRFSV